MRPRKSAPVKVPDFFSVHATSAGMLTSAAPLSTMNFSVSTSLASGKVYVINPASSVYTDDGFAYTALIQTAHSDFGDSKRKTFLSATVVGDQEPQFSPLAIDWTDDDYQTFSDPRAVDMRNDIRRTNRLGSSRKRAFRLSHSANTPLRVQALDLDIVESVQ